MPLPQYKALPGQCRPPGRPPTARVELGSCPSLGASASPTSGLGFFFFRRRGCTGQQPPLRVALGSLQSSVCLPSSPFAPAQLWVSPPTPVHPSPISAPSASRDQPPPLPLHFWLGLSSLFLYLPKLISAAVSPGLGLSPSCPQPQGSPTLCSLPLPPFSPWACWASILASVLCSSLFLTFLS